MKRRIRQYIEKHNLLSTESKVIVGLSGGADSVVLLHILHDLGYDCIAAHCNFHLRGEESVRDEKAATAFAASLSIPFFRIDFDTYSVASERGISIEMAARDLRYEWFEQLRKEHDCDTIAVAHHRDDSIETMILNLIRGTGIKGLTGIKPKNGLLVRPLLCISKEELIQYAEKEHLPFVIDSTNLQDNFARNKIRLQILPLLRTMNPSVDDALVQTMNNLNEVALIYDAEIEVARKHVLNSELGQIDIAGLLTSPSPESVLFEILKEYGFGKEVVQDIYNALSGQSGKEFYSSTHQVIKDRKHLLVLPKKENEEELIYAINKEDVFIQAPFSMTIEFRNNTPDFEIDRNRNIACLDFDQLQFPLYIRKWKSGDRFVPLGMKGFQKLSDYFSNHKFSKPQKEGVWILCSGDHIVWIIGHRIDDRFSMSKQTKKVCIFKLL